MIGLNFVVSHMFRNGGTAIVEAPAYDRMLGALTLAGADVERIDNTDAGPDFDRLRELAAGNPKPKLLYVLPTFHNPTGRTLTLEQRRELVAIAVEHELLVVEDDPYGLLRIDGEPQPYVYELLREAGAEHLAVFASSFSKSVAPGLRVGYFIVPESLVAPLEALVTRTYVSPPLLAQAQLFEFLLSGAFEPHLEFLASFLRPGRLLPLARASSGDRHGRAECRRGRRGNQLRSRSGLLRRPEHGQALLQLPVGRRDRGGCPPPDHARP
jgi:DNA-binding transcriptional MocR family regulator